MSNNYPIPERDFNNRFDPNNAAEFQQALEKVKSGPALLCAYHYGDFTYTHPGKLKGINDVFSCSWECCDRRGIYVMCPKFWEAFEPHSSEIPITKYHRQEQDEAYERRRQAWGYTGGEEAYDRS